VRGSFFAEHETPLRPVRRLVGFLRKEMDIKKCYEILELDPNASLAEAKQAYKDLVNIWHPDRVSHNARLKQRAENKLKEVNAAYEKLEVFLSSKQDRKPAPKQAPEAEVHPYPEGETTEAEAGYQGSTHAEAAGRDKTEVAVENATGMILAACSYLYNSLRRLIEGQARKAGTEAEVKAGQEEVKESEWQRYERGKGQGRGRGKGRGMGRGGGRGMGRGKSRRGGRGRP
jgi:curved DNA-binding protein CbpA